MDENNSQIVLEFMRPENIILTNLGMNEAILAECSEEEQKHWKAPRTIVASHHQRGADELPHRALKDFGTEQLPFKRFAANQAFYYIMLIAFFFFEAFKRDTLAGVLPITAYPATVRRNVIDIAAKIVTSGHQRVVKVTSAVMKRLNFQKLWWKCQYPPLLIC